MHASAGQFWAKMPNFRHSKMALSVEFCTAVCTAECNVQCAVYNLQCNAMQCIVQCSMCNMQFSVSSVEVGECAMVRPQSVVCTMCGFQCAVFNVQCAVWNLQWLDRRVGNRHAGSRLSGLLRRTLRNIRGHSGNITGHSLGRHFNANI